ncbi:MAG: OmpA family protein [Rickettsiales bacterium]|nr:OmpA family protein [Rickettsiales bacterium]
MASMRAFWLVAFFYLASCSGETLESLRNVTPNGSALQQALSKYYLDLADQEAARLDWWSSQHFATKGLASAYGDAVQPEKMEYWHLDIDDKNERDALAQARAWLMAHLAHPQRMPQELAQAQVYYDCWIEEAAEPFNSPARAHCRESMEAALMKLGPVTHTTSGAIAQNPLQATDVSLTYLVFFDSNSDRLNHDAMEVLDIILTDLHNIDQYEIVLNGNADTRGEQEANVELSLRRAKQVEKTLIESGVAPELISLYAFGETDLKEPTNDQVTSRVNRRVEVVIN